MVLVAYPAWCTSGVYGFDDLGRLNIPQRMLLAWFYLNGHWPLWNPFNFAGQPFLAAGQSGPLYLPNVLFLFIPVVPVVKVTYLLHEWLAAFGTYAAAYQLSKSRLGGVVAVASFLTCGFLLGHHSTRKCLTPSVGCPFHFGCAFASSIPSRCRVWQGWPWHLPWKSTQVIRK